MVSSMNAKVLSRTCRISASISSFSWTISGSSGIGVLSRISRDLTTAIGTCNRLKNGASFGGFLKTLSALLMIARSIVIRWPVTSPADHRPSAVLVFHWSGGIASAARRSSLCARARFSRMIARRGKGLSASAKKKDSDRSPAGLLESVSQLQHFRFSKRGSEDLQAHWQPPLDLAAGY